MARAKVKVIGGTYKGPKPTTGVGTVSRARSLGGVFKPKRAPNPFVSSKRFETLASGYKKVRPF